MVNENTFCGFLKSMKEIEDSTKFLLSNKLLSNEQCQCKDWDIAHIIPQIHDGNLLDMGSFGSFVLINALRKGVKGEKYGIDLSPQTPLSGVHYLVGDLMNVPIKDGFFDYITCLSVIEHEVNFSKFAAETSRLLSPGGRLFVTFDYWNPKVVPTIKLFGLGWYPLDWIMVNELVRECDKVGLKLEREIDQSIGVPIIKEGYHSPEPGIEYTFGLVSFRKENG